MPSVKYYEKKKINDYVTDFSESASYDSFEPESDPTIEEDEYRLPPEIEDDESEDSDFELESSSAEEESTESGNEDKQLLNQQLRIKKGNGRSKKSEIKAERDAVFQQILSSSNPNNIPTYENPTTKNKRTSTKKTTTLKDAECNICKIKFTKHDLTRHRNSCQAKAAKKN